MKHNNLGSLLSSSYQNLGIKNVFLLQGPNNDIRYSLDGTQEILNIFDIDEVTGDITLLTGPVRGVTRSSITSLQVRAFLRTNIVLQIQYAK